MLYCTCHLVFTTMLLDHPNLNTARVLVTIPHVDQHRHTTFLHFLGRVGLFTVPPVTVPLGFFACPVTAPLPAPAAFDAVGVPLLGILLASVLPVTVPPPRPAAPVTPPLALLAAEPTAGFFCDAGPAICFF